MFDALNHRRRRALCRELGDAAGPRPLDDLALALAAGERDDDADPTNYGWEKLYAALYHRHVPKLAELAVLRFDPDEGTVAAGDRFPVARAALAAVERTLTAATVSAQGATDE